MKKRKSGRPLKNGEKLKAFTIAATPSELEIWKAAARQDNRALSAWIRLVLNAKLLEEEYAQARKLLQKGAVEGVAAVSAGAPSGDTGRG